MLKDDTAPVSEPVIDKNEDNVDRFLKYFDKDANGKISQDEFDYILEGKFGPWKKSVASGKQGYDDYAKKTLAQIEKDKKLLKFEIQTIKSQLKIKEQGVEHLDRQFDLVKLNKKKHYDKIDGEYKDLNNLKQKWKNAFASATGDKGYATSKDLEAVRG